MNKTEILDICAKNQDERLLLAKVLDKVEQSRNKQTLEHTGFLSPSEAVAVAALLRHYGDVQAEFSGGFLGAERVMSLFLPDWMFELESEDLPMVAVKIQISKLAKISHRDILGSLMGLGLTREKVGDILVEAEWAVVVVAKSVLDVILSQWNSVGRQSVEPVEIPLAEIGEKSQTVKIIKDTVASLRIDSLVASGFAISRTKAAEQIEGGKVQINHVEVLKTDKQLEIGDVISCRGLGKCVLANVVGKSKKDRHIIEIHRYI